MQNKVTLFCKVTVKMTDRQQERRFFLHFFRFRKAVIFSKTERKVTGLPACNFLTNSMGIHYLCTRIPTKRPAVFRRGRRPEREHREEPESAGKEPGRSREEPGRARKSQSKAGSHREPNRRRRQEGPESSRRRAAGRAGKSRSKAESHREPNRRRRQEGPESSRRRAAGRAGKSRSKAESHREPNRPLERTTGDIGQ